LEAGDARPFEERQVYFEGAGWVPCPVYWREGLPAGVRLEGPAIVEEHGSTTLVEPAQQLHVDDHGLLVIHL
jgi:N-methylhydantoinase A